MRNNSKNCESVLKIGDKVKLKSGGANMMISNRYQYDDGSKYCTCEWQDSNFNPNRNDYHEDTLEKVEKTEKKVGL